MHEVFQKARDERNLTNAELARTIGVSESLISKIMSGKRKPAKKAAEIYRVLGIPEPINHKRSA